MDTLNNYESSALAHPTDKKGSSKTQKRLDAIVNEINISLYGTTSTGNRNMFELAKAQGGGNVV